MKSLQAQTLELVQKMSANTATVEDVDRRIEEKLGTNTPGGR